MASLLLTACGIRSTVQQYAMNLRDKTRDSYADHAAMRNPGHPVKGEGGDMLGASKPKPGDQQTSGGQAASGSSAGGQAGSGASNSGSASAPQGGQAHS